MVVDKTSVVPAVFYLNIFFTQASTIAFSEGGLVDSLTMIYTKFSDSEAVFDLSVAVSYTHLTLPTILLV